MPQLQAAVWAGTIDWRDGHFQGRLALSPARIPSPVIVIRLDDSVHEAWREPAPRTSEELDRQIGSILDHVKGSGLLPAVVQLDYDCPSGRLANWSEALRALKKGSLHGTEVWITSLIDHLRDPRFGALFRDTVAGQVLQVFDTGDAFADGRPAAVLRDLERQGLPFQMGFGAFERKSRSGEVTQHREWLRSLPLFSKSALYRGAWIFPAGLPWIAQVKEVL